VRVAQKHALFRGASETTQQNRKRGAQRSPFSLYTDLVVIRGVRRKAEGSQFLPYRDTARYFLNQLRIQKGAASLRPMTAISLWFERLAESRTQINLC
jgi:hypothetical protein